MFPNLCLALILLLLLMCLAACNEHWSKSTVNTISIVGSIVGVVMFVVHLWHYLALPGHLEEHLWIATALIDFLVFVISACLYKFDRTQASE